MERYLKTSIKSLIEMFPEVGAILESHGITCVSCTVGTCALEDVVRFHVLAPADEAEMMAHLAQVTHPGRAVAPTRRSLPRQPAAPRQLSYSPPVRKLVEEHKLIKRLLALIPQIVKETRASGEINAELLSETLDFIRGYADRFHHMKEEDILFDYTDREAEINRVILQDHDQARGFVKAAAQAIESGDCSALCASLSAYQELLIEHITKEDEILYPYIDRGLAISQVGEIFRRFEEVEGQLDSDIPERYERFIVSLENRFSKEKERCPTALTDVQVPA